ncbi:CPBP family intramembrane glutamic endopeptidase [Methylosinus sp. KRF6]|uniref:CPBP family intramembrane glutamic endopeptidase n=1 Tax=Methylosinus sp. KRF6 TaxID=2846853 RepID=UPI001C0B3E41|nr:type II CAAX endopeptidase family protein [Methylosinus sp. KRF6]MBU3887873.1 CPBP family intramembrane metalloprotease [Methylosinus sp. KRF6]
MAPSRRVLTSEVAVFLLLIVPSLVLSLFVIRQGQLSFVLAATATIFRDVGLVCLILYFLWRNGEPVDRLGWTRRHMVRELAIGIVCFAPVFLGAALLERALVRVGLSAPTTPLPSFLNDKGAAEALLATLLVTVVALAEETIFRGYLLLRFQGILRSTTASVLLSSAVFALGHGYEGSAGVVTVGTMGALFALVYLWRRSLVAPVVMHFLQDFLTIVLLPAFERFHS